MRFGKSEENRMERQNEREKGQMKRGGLHTEKQ